MFKGTLSGLRPFLPAESPLKMMKNAFYLTSKAFFVQTIAIHIVSNISRSKYNQTMKFGQLIECNRRNIFLDKSYTKCGGETSRRPFSEKLKLRISLDQ